MFTDEDCERALEALVANGGWEANMLRGHGYPLQ